MALVMEIVLCVMLNRDLLLVLTGESCVLCCLVGDIKYFFHLICPYPQRVLVLFNNMLRSPWTVSPRLLPPDPHEKTAENSTLYSEIPSESSTSVLVTGLYMMLIYLQKTLKYVGPDCNFTKY